MRKIVTWVLLGAGAFLLVAAGLAKFWAPGQVERTPLDVNTTTHLDGTAVKLGESNTVKATSRTAVDSKKSDSRVVVFVNTTCLVTTASPTDCGRKGTGKNADPNVVSISTDVFATNRHTGQSVNDSKYLPSGTEPKEGLVNKWPFNVEQKTYSYWDDVMGKAVPAKYAGEEFVHGLKTYRFEIELSDEPAEVVSGVQGTYSQDKKIWVEPKSGSIVDQRQHEVRKLSDGGTALDLELAFTADQVKTSVEDAEDNRSQLRLVEDLIPLVGLILGVVLLLAGILSLLAARRRRTS